MIISVEVGVECDECGDGVWVDVPLIEPDRLDMVSLLDSLTSSYGWEERSNDSFICDECLEEEE